MSNVQGSIGSSVQLQEFKEVLKSLVFSRKKYLKQKILCDALEDCITSDNLDQELKSKIRDIVREHGCQDLKEFETEGFNIASSYLLGLTELDETKLTYEESLKVRKTVELILKDKYENICEDFKDVTREEVHDVLYDKSGNENRVLLELRLEILNQQAQYLENLSECIEILEDLMKLRLEKLPRVCKDKIKEFDIKTDINCLRIKILQEKTRIDVLTKSEKSLKGYEQIIREIEEQQQQCEAEIAGLKMFKEKYNQSFSEEYSEILKSYVNYKLALEKKQLMYESLNK